MHIYTNSALRYPNQYRRKNSQVTIQPVTVSGFCLRGSSNTHKTHTTSLPVFKTQNKEFKTPLLKWRASSGKTARQTTIYTSQKLLLDHPEFVLTFSNIYTDTHISLELLNPPIGSPWTSIADWMTECSCSVIFLLKRILCENSSIHQLACPELV